MGNKLAVIRPESDLLQQWERALDLDERAGNISATTRNTYRAGMAQFIAWCKESGVERVTPDTLEQWKASRLGMGSKPTAINTWLSGIKRFFEWASGRELLEANPTAGVKNVKRKGANKRHLREALTDREVLRVLAMPDRATAQGKRDYAILCLMAFCALREVEITRADVDDLSTGDGYPILRLQGKGSTEKDDFAVIAHPTAQDALDEWLMERGSQPGALFISLSRRTYGGRMSSRSVRELVRYMRDANIPNGRKTLHSLRHSAISKVAKKDLMKARQVARHSDISTTMIYVHENDRLTNPGEGFIDYVNGNGENGIKQ